MPDERNKLPLPPIPSLDDVPRAEGVTVTPLPEMGDVGDAGGESIKDFLREAVELLRDIRDAVEGFESGGEPLG